MKEFQSMVILAASVFGGLIVLATLYKILEECMARRWPSTHGRVVKSEERWEEAEGTDLDGRLAVGNYLLVEYEYEVNGQNYRGHRVALGHDARNAEVAETLARYPVGATVTVHYNPARPAVAILERQPLLYFAQGLAGILPIIACGAAAMFFGVKYLLIFGERILPNAEHTDAVILCGALGLMSVLFALFSLLQTLKERRWPSVLGQIVSSNVDISQETVRVSGGMGSTSRARRPMTTVYRPIVVYRYDVDGLQHKSSRITAGIPVRASAPEAAKKVVRRYPAGSAVTVRYNPARVAESILETSLGGLFTGLILGAALLATAVALSGYLHRAL